MRSDSAVRSLIPARLDRLPWARFHWMVVVGLGIAWTLDGLEGQLVSLAGFQQDLGMSNPQVAWTGTFYLLGQVVGALVFGRLTDRWGRRKLFIITLGIYLVGCGVAGFATNVWWLWAFRFIAGMGIGGEVTAINSAIDELIPAKYRGRVDIAINGTFWAGAALGAAAGVFLLDPAYVPEGWGWRLGFFVGPVIGLAIVFMRRGIPESPRWMVTHGQADEAERVTSEIEQHVRDRGKHLPEVDESRAILLHPRERQPFSVLFDVFFRRYPRRTILGITMMVTQSFFYNAIFFTYAIVLKNFYDVPGHDVSWFFFPFAVGNFLGPILLGPLFDILGRRIMIFGTYALSAVVLTVSAFLFHAGVLNAESHTILWSVCFFFASAGASSAYLTVSEIFPLEVRAQALSYFFAVSQGAGAAAPAIFGALIGSGTARGPLFVGYLVGAGLITVGAIVAAVLGVDAERKGLEEVADPLTKVNG